MSRLLLVSLALLCMILRAKSLSLEKSEEGISMDKRTLTFVRLDGDRYWCSQYKNNCSCQYLLCNNQQSCGNGRCRLLGRGGRNWKNARTGIDCQCKSKAAKKNKND